jgi:two-component system, OmpR family, sensor histidine kinase SenX3
MRTLSVMDATTVAVLAGAVGVVIGAGAVLAVRYSERQQHTVPEPAVPPALPAGVADVLAVLRSSGIVVDSADEVINNSPPAVAYGLVRGRELVHEELRDLARQVRRDGVIREAELKLPRGPMGLGRAAVMHARVAPLGSEQVLLLVEDQTQAQRVEEVRRDFVANVSHELKTPVGGIALLAEAVLDAKDDPDAVARFAQRIQVESSRLTQLVKEIVDLSRLQVADTLHEPRLVNVTAALREATEHTRISAEAKQIELAESSAPDLKVYGDDDLIVTAVRNLIANAIAYSEPGTRVAVGGRQNDSMVEITVSDQGHGIPASEQQRIFERFYRVDEARSRATGGTGLGLAIVKHICANHGGDVTVWSEPGRGSTFTIRLPAALDRSGGDRTTPTARREAEE